jgi:predicted permease
LYNLFFEFGLICHCKCTIGQYTARQWATGVASVCILFSINATADACGTLRKNEPQQIHAFCVAGDVAVAVAVVVAVDVDVEEVCGDDLASGLVGMVRVDVDVAGLAGLAAVVVGVLVVARFAGTAFKAASASRLYRCCTS